MIYKVLKKQNIGKSCIVCGNKNELGLKSDFYELENGELVCVCNTKDWHQSYPGRVHGGISAALLDETIGRAVSIGDDQVWGVTVSLELKYKKPVPTDEKIYVVGRITKENRKLFEGTGEIILSNGDIAATAHGKYMKMPIDMIAGEEFGSDEWFENPDDVEYIEIPDKK
ncbi:PaaI family thioesterase [Peptacetobacter hominis]|uniref:Acyl-coenzyme A thioesterase THEM4 n=1 Tax=Peptacetobacter hominis TaxID=2743610 RepID=A0A544QYI3_9FIRM|nr:PaaI family thioesterase [Peptacetobacter hominis]TQQ85772.1 PaaI family thioesterase [Peptacetobacter hominis]